MSDYYDDYESGPRRRKMWVKEVRAKSLTDAFIRLDEWANTGNEAYDMYYIEYDTYYEDYVKLIIVGLETESTRFLYDV
jgi:hypothetical protein